MIEAVEGQIGQKYRTSFGLIQIIEKRRRDVVVISANTDHKILLPLNYKIFPAEVISMSEDTVATVVKTESGKKLKKSNVVDDGLRDGLSTDEIVKNVLTSFPETPEKSIRNLVSVRRSKQKKPV